MRFLLYALLLAVAAFAFTNVKENTADAPDGAASVVAVQAEMPVLAADPFAAIDHPAYIKAAPMLADPAIGDRTTAGPDTRLAISNQSHYCTAKPVNYKQATYYERAYHLLCHQGRARSTGLNVADLRLNYEQATNCGTAYHLLCYQGRSRSIVVNVASLRPLVTGIKREGRAQAPSIAVALSPRLIV